MTPKTPKHYLSVLDVCRVPHNTIVNVIARVEAIREDFINLSDWGSRTKSGYENELIVWLDKPGKGWRPSEKFAEGDVVVLRGFKKTTGRMKGNSILYSKHACRVTFYDQQSRAYNDFVGSHASPRPLSSDAIEYIQGLLDDWKQDPRSGGYGEGDGPLDGVADSSVSAVGKTSVAMSLRQVAASFDVNRSCTLRGALSSTGSDDFELSDETGYSVTLSSFDHGPRNTLASYCYGTDRAYVRISNVRFKSQLSQNGFFAKISAASEIELLPETEVRELMENLGEDEQQPSEMGSSRDKRDSSMQDLPDPESPVSSPGRHKRSRKDKTENSILDALADTPVFMGSLSSVQSSPESKPPLSSTPTRPARKMVQLVQKSGEIREEQLSRREYELGESEQSDATDTTDALIGGAREQAGQLRRQSTGTVDASNRYTDPSLPYKMQEYRAAVAEVTYFVVRGRLVGSGKDEDMGLLYLDVEIYERGVPVIVARMFIGAEEQEYFFNSNLWNEVAQMGVLESVVENGQAALVQLSAVASRKIDGGYFSYCNRIELVSGVEV